MTAVPPMFVMLVGMPASGKSTYRETHDHSTYVHLSTDDIVADYASRHGLNYDDVWADQIDAATKTVAKLFAEAVERYDSIIWDQTNLTPKKRRGILRAVPPNYLKIAVYFEVPEELRKHRQAARTGKFIPTDVIENMRRSYVRPSIEEGFDYVIDHVKAEGVAA